MIQSREPSAILFWTSETDPAFAAPAGAPRLSNSNLHHRVVRVVTRNDGWARIRFGDEEFAIKEECLTFIEPMQLHVSDRVKFSGGHGVIRDIIWHFKDGVPNYYLERDGKKLSKRYLTADLAQF
ncbi:hypothetical protein [Neorhizobium sp. JUb45]|uniref:hypothetical protein n=1 Tax=Neorhizobium sp. JUb45 TaxID=2485113 RepID=UPI0010533321|nr:hypothetical protein [Neorhizobium sp. JUb45]